MTVPNAMIPMTKVAVTEATIFVLVLIALKVSERSPINLSVEKTRALNTRKAIYMN